jgi:serine/threonine protein kinase
LIAAEADPTPVSMSAALGPGSRLGKYQIIRRLALGGMAELYLARYVGSTGFEKVVAIKRVHPHLAEDEDFVRMFLNEAKLAAGLDHQNIAHVIDFGTVDGEHFMAMEYVHGRGVHQILRESKGSLPIECALAIVQGVAAALHYAHERTRSDGRPMGLVHRDVSPSNVLVSYEGEVKLLDFGIAKATAVTRATRTGTIKGKLAYMAPEQVRGEDIDRRADVFSLGTVLYELTTGRRCFYAPGEFALINRVAEGRYTKPSAIDPDFPRELEAIISKALRVDRDERYATARELQQAIETYATAQGIQLSPISLSTFMRATFGAEVYPTTDLIPLPTHAVEVAAARRQTLYTWSRRIRGRRPITWMLLAGAVGLTIGLSGKALLGQADSEPSPSAAAELPRDSSAVASEVPSPAPKVDVPAEVDAIDVILEEETHEGFDEPTPARRKKSTRSARRAKNEPKTKNTARPTGQEYLPPSRRQ